MQPSTPTGDAVSGDLASRNSPQEDSFDQVQASSAEASQSIEDSHANHSNELVLRDHCSGDVEPGGSFLENGDRGDSCSVDEAVVTSSFATSGTSDPSSDIGEWPTELSAEARSAIVRRGPPGVQNVNYCFPKVTRPGDPTKGPRGASRQSGSTENSPMVKKFYECEWHILLRGKLCIASAAGSFRPRIKNQDLVLLKVSANDGN